jgi:hypothetical protein
MIVTGIDYTRHRILVIVRGATPKDEIFETIGTLFASPEFLSGFDLLWDHTLAEHNPGWTGDEIRRLAEHYSRLHGQARRVPAREAVVVSKSNPLSFGLVRMFQMQAEPGGGDVQMRTFETRADAEAWLDQPSPAAPSGTAH